MVVDDEMQDEFGTMAAWTREAVSVLGTDHAMPAAYARERAGVRPVCVDPMGQASAAVPAFFGLPAVVGEGARLPFVDKAFALVWSLGTLCTTEDKATWLAELRRVLRPSGRLGLLVVTATGESLSVPWGNAFPSRGELTALLTATGFTVLDQIWSDELADADAAWQRREDAVEAAVRDAHGDDDRYATVKRQERRMAVLFESGRIRGRLLVAAAAG